VLAANLAYTDMRGGDCSNIERNASTMGFETQQGTVRVHLHSFLLESHWMP